MDDDDDAFGPDDRDEPERLGEREGRSDAFGLGVVGVLFAAVALIAFARSHSDLILPAGLGALVVAALYKSVRAGWWKKPPPK